MSPEPVKPRTKKATKPGEVVDLGRELNGFTDADNKPRDRTALDDYRGGHL